MKITLSLFLFFISHLLLGGVGDTLNRVDSSGKRQGHWKITAAMKNRTDFPSADAIFEEGRYVNGQKNGPWTEYYPNGNRRSTMEYTNNRPNGTATLYFENGHVSETGTWKGTRWIGEYRAYYETDTLRWIFNYNPLGQRSGTQYYYWPNGKLQLVCRYTNGKEDGWAHYYYEDGSLERDAYFSSAHPDSNRVIDYPPRNTSMHGNFGYDRSGPEVAAETEKTPYDPGVKWTCPPGCECEGNKIINGRAHLYDCDGVLLRIEIYRNGIYVGDAPLPEAD